VIDLNSIRLPHFFLDEPVGVLLSALVAFLIGGYYRKRLGKIGWSRSVLFSAILSLTFFGLIFGGYAFMESNIVSFSTLHQSFTSGGSISWSKWRNALKEWGGPITQHDLQVSHYFETSILATLPVTDPSRPLLYQTYTARQIVPQNSIVHFQGNVKLISGKKMDADKFNGFFIDAHYGYDVVNQSEMEVETEFLFPLARTDGFFENIHVQADGREVDGLQVNNGNLFWVLHMEPNQKVTISISYTSKGTDGYQYVVSQAREIKNFNLSISSDDPNIFVSVTPSGESIHQNLGLLSDGSLSFDVLINHIVAAPVVGISYVQTTNPYAPLDLFLRLLKFVPRSILFLTAVSVLILLISQVSFGFVDLVIIQASFWLYVLILILLGPVVENPKWILIASSVLTSGLIIWALKHLKMSRFPLVSLLFWIIAMLGFYPLTGEFVNTFPFNQYDNVALVTILVYTFSYLLWSRIGENIKSNSNPNR
jgi:hypothetical protein